MVKSLISFNRSPTWIAPQFAGHLASAGRATTYTEEEKEKFRNDPDYLRQYRKQIDQALNSRFPNFYKGSQEQKASRQIVETAMRERLTKMNPDLREKLIPDFDVGCRRYVAALTMKRRLEADHGTCRVTPGDGYLEALQEPNVEVVRTRIQEVTPEGVVTADGKLYAVDVIIAATGYDTSYVPPFPLIGRNGVDLGKRWARTGAEAYLTCAVPDMPNYFSAFYSPTPVQLILTSVSGGRSKHAHLQRLSNARNRKPTSIRPHVCQEDPERGNQGGCGQPASDDRVQRAQGRRHETADLFW